MARTRRLLVRRLGLIDVLLQVMKKSGRCQGYVSKIVTVFTVVRRCAPLEHSLSYWYIAPMVAGCVRLPIDVWVLHGSPQHGIWRLFRLFSPTAAKKGCIISIGTDLEPNTAET